MKKRIAVLKKFLHTYPNAGFDYSVFTEHRDEILQINERNLNVLCYILLFYGLFLLGASFQIPNITNLKLAYITMVLSGTVFHLLAKHLLPSRNQLTLPLLYLFVTIIYLCIITIGVQNPTNNATTICVLLAIMPIMLIDRPHHVSCFTTLITILFCVAALLLKERKIAVLDLVNAISFWICGVVLQYYIAHTQVQNIVVRKKIESQRDRDGLTHLYNRAALKKLIEQHLLEHPTISSAVFLIDLDNFKSVNDIFGHMEGDRILRETARILVRSFHRDARIGRLGGDEFMVFIPEIRSVRWLYKRGERIVNDLEQFVSFDGKECKVSGSVGIAVSPQCGSTFDSLYLYADEAMYKAKNGGKSDFTILGITDELKKKILVVDDQEVIRSSYRSILEKEYLVREAADCEKAYEILSAEKDIMLLLLDHHLPGKSGIEFLKALREDPQMSSLQIIMITGEHDDDTKITALELGAKYFVEKPVNAELLKRLVEQVILED